MLKVNKILRRDSMKALYAVIPLGLLLVLGVVFFIMLPGSDEEGPENVAEETAATEETAGEQVSDDEAAEEADDATADEEMSEEDPGEENAQKESAEEASEEADTEDEQEASREEAPEETEASGDKEESEEQNGATAGNERNYNAAEQCIMSELTECEGVAVADQFQAYQNLVADGTLPQAPGSDCLPCAVKYSFEAEYGESRDIDTTVVPRSIQGPGEIDNMHQFVRQYLFALPAYFNDIDRDALDFYHPDSEGYNLLAANKASGDYSNHMTYAVHLDSEEANQDGSTDIFAYRTYSHTNTDGIFEAYTRYNVIEEGGRYYLTDYEEIENVRIE